MFKPPCYAGFYSSGAYIKAVSLSLKEIASEIFGHVYFRCQGLLGASFMSTRHLVSNTLISNLAFLWHSLMFANWTKIKVKSRMEHHIIKELKGLFFLPNLLARGNMALGFLTIIKCNACSGQTIRPLNSSVHQAASQGWFVCRIEVTGLQTYIYHWKQASCSQKLNQYPHICYY